METKSARRLNRLFDRLERKIPAKAAGLLQRIRRPEARLIRIPLGILLVLGGIFSFLPVLGIWMLPLGLLILAIDLIFLQGPVNHAILRGGRHYTNWSRKRRDKKAMPKA
ncbi:hypothetical protein DevBK_05050 [Devosia sp. BK]|jgi:hypothetical protein|uniref:hypothetical protein n=1 Tax=unclassified Devosia TaxID=196773 RepID=UPI000714B0E0|nr:MULTISPECIES: hypothetical protein [unclassified Devosia]KQN74064.1 hypothetical protein ASE94_03395 [Devosia sp. Leaf64]KQT51229.1 hypothetical protein ASG47_18835 [Devosia sp. Leaf420]MDV3250698.1 hypothetical protein [Devosia sp. BK]